MARSIQNIVDGIVMALKQFKEENPEHRSKLDIMEDYLTDEVAPWFDPEEEDRDDEPCY